MISEASKTPISHAGVYAEESGKDEEKEEEAGYKDLESSYK